MTTSPAHPRKSPDPAIVHGLSSNCIRKLQKKKTTRWWSDGKRILRVSSSSCVLMFASVQLSVLTGRVMQTGLFSAVVATLVAVSVQDLRPNSQDTSSFYLEKMYQLQADPDVSRPSNLSAAAKPPAFSPPSYAILVNTLWFLSLVVSLTCAMLATLLQQWARRHVMKTQLPRRSPEKRARMHAFFANGVDKFHVSWAVEALPALVHLSLFTFFVGLLVFLFNINHTVFNAVICWVALSSAVYACITLIPIFWHDSPFYTHLSSPASLPYAVMAYSIFKLLESITYKRIGYSSHVRLNILKERYRDRIFGGLGKAVEQVASKWSPELDSRIVKWTVEAEIRHILATHLVIRFGLSIGCFSPVFHLPRCRRCGRWLLSSFEDPSRYIILDILG
jgi:hypothetical protein